MLFDFLRDSSQLGALQMIEFLYRKSYSPVPVNSLTVQREADSQPYRYRERQRQRERLVSSMGV